MFGWYVDIYSKSDYYQPTNMSQLTLLDSDRPIAFSNGGEITKVYKQDLVNPYDFAKEYLGDFVNYIYTPPSTYWLENYFNSLDLFFPSIELSATNTWRSGIVKEVSGIQKSRYIYIYFKSIKKLYGPISGSSAVYRNENGNLVPVYSGNQSPVVFRAKNESSTNGIWAEVYFPHLVGSVSTKEWWRQPWQQCEITKYPSTGRWYVKIDTPVTPSGEKLTGLNALFTDSEPEFDYPPEIPPENPYGPGGDSEPGTEPPGTFDDSSDAIPDSSLPTLSAANTGFTRIYNPTLAQVQDLARYLWTDETIIETIWNKIKQYFENPMDAIIGFNLVPVAVPNGGTKNFALMYIDTGVQMTAAASQFVDQDCGSVKLERYYGSALDQSPYTKVSCFLPYIGTVQLNTDEVMGTTLQIKYRVDIVSGSCVAKIFVDGNLLYQYSGHCAINIPFSSADFSTYVSAAISVAKLAVGAAVGGGVGAIAATSQDAVQQTNQVVTRTSVTTDTARNPVSGRQYVTGTRSVVETTERPVDTSSTQASFDGLSAANVSNTVGQIMSSKPHVEHSGSFSGNTGYLGVRRPFLIIERPNMCMPKNYQQFNGFPSMITMKFADCKGYTRVQQVKLTGVSATNPEQAEILTLLKSGVYF